MFVAAASESAGIRDQRVWGIKECAKVFEESIGKLRDELNKQGDGGMLVWDKVFLKPYTSYSNVLAVVLMGSRTGYAKKMMFTIENP